ncbi:hypothetical protein C7M84_001516 [Penaeus vannamei]|uniref:Uncharacterized protein n=1 Tax=Penaeus vannamei TaxID=6689 RepID=A0A423TTM0_PENVA|nr:hypothetical protein C7M84_001516 [Penaeus vannamei]
MLRPHGTAAPARSPTPRARCKPHLGLATETTSPPIWPGRPPYEAREEGTASRLTMVNMAPMSHYVSHTSFPCDWERPCRKGATLEFRRTRPSSTSSGYTLVSPWSKCGARLHVRERQLYILVCMVRNCTTSAPLSLYKKNPSHPFHDLVLLRTPSSVLVRASPCDPRPLRRRGVTSWRSVKRNLVPAGRFNPHDPRVADEEVSLRVSDPPDKERSAPGLETRTLPGNATRGRPRLEAGSGMTRGKEPAEEGGAESERRRAVGSTSAGRDRYAASHGGNGPQPEPRPSPPPSRAHGLTHRSPQCLASPTVTRNTCDKPAHLRHTPRRRLHNSGAIENRRACAFAFAGERRGCWTATSYALDTNLPPPSPSSTKETPTHSANQDLD